jgi:hypothetical protein
LTPGSGLPYFSAKQEDRRREGLLQRIHVRTSQKCPRCKGKFKDVGNNLACPKCQTVATRLHLEWWTDNKRYYIGGFDSYTDALRKAIKIEIDINSYSFKPEKYKDDLNNLVCNKCQTVATRMYLEWWINNKRYYLNGFKSYIDAQRKAVSIETDINNYSFKPAKYKDKNKQVAKKYRFSFAYEGWLKQKQMDLERGDIAPSYYEKVKQYGKEFTRFFNDMDIRAMNSLDIKKFRNSLPSSLAPKTQKNKLNVLQKFFKDLFDDEILDKIPKFPKIKTQSTEPVWITRDIQVKILSSIPVEHRPVIEFLIETGLRPAEVRALKWGVVEEDHIQIRAGFSNGIFREITKTAPLFQSYSH